MNGISHVWRLSNRERYSLLRTALVVVTIRVALWAIPFTVLRSKLKPYLKVQGVPPPFEPEIKALARGVRSVSRRVPGATCLTQALSLQVLLARAGFESVLRIGVQKTGEGTFKAHAWLEKDGRILIGGRERREYSTTLDLKEGKL
jgi:hypothetical protein